MSRWNHAICVDCFSARQPRYEPVVLRVVNAETLERVRRNELCCFCAARTDAGIYIRADPKTTMCAGVSDSRFTAHKEDDA